VTRCRCSGPWVQIGESNHELTVAAITCRAYGPGSFRRGAFEVECEEFLEKLVVGQGGVPAVGGEDGGVEAAVGEVEPGGALVVEIRERPLGQALGRLG